MIPNKIKAEKIKKAKEEVEVFKSSNLRKNLHMKESKRGSVDRSSVAHENLVDQSNASEYNEEIDDRIDQEEDVPLMASIQHNKSIRK